MGHKSPCHHPGTNFLAFIGSLALLIMVIWLIQQVTTDCHEEATQAEIDACYKSSALVHDNGGQ